MVLGMIKEEWRDAPSKEDRLEVSSLGGVRTKDYVAPSTRYHQPFQLRRGKVLSPYVGKSGYFIVSLKTGSVRRKLLLHRLVALAFVPGHFDGATVDHIDGNKLNNHAENLRWVTLAENSRLQNADGRGVPKGELHPGAKLTDREAEAVLALMGSGFTCTEIAQWFDVSPSLVAKMDKQQRRAPQSV